MDIIDIGVASRIGSYSDAIAVPAGQRWLVTSGTPGLTGEGKIPEGIEAQAEQAWRHINIMLERGGMDLSNVVKVNQYLISADDIDAYAEVRSQVLGKLRPASLLLVVAQLIKPEIRLEIEVYAARP